MAVLPGQSELGSSYALLREQVDEAVSAGELQPLNIDVTAMALYGAVRSGGEYVIAAADRSRAVSTATRTLDYFIEGLLAAP